MTWTASNMVLPLRLSSHGMMAAHAAQYMPGRCVTPKTYQEFMDEPDMLKVPPYYDPKFYCLSRAVCFAPGYRILVIFPHDQNLFFDRETPLENNLTQAAVEATACPPDPCCWTIELSCSAQKPFVFGRETPLENVLIHPDMMNCTVQVSCSLMQKLRQTYAEFLSCPVAQKKLFSWKK
jgi:hypothetical protein